MASIARPDASASRHPRAPHPQRRPLGSTMMWPTWPALPECAVEQLAVEHDAAADAGRHRHHAVVVDAPWRRPASPRRAPAPCRRGRRRRGGRSARRRADRSGKSRHAGMLTGETVSQLAGDRSRRADADATRSTSWRSAATSCCSTISSASVAKCASGPDVLVDEADARSSSSPRGVDQPGGELRAADVDGEDDRAGGLRRRRHGGRRWRSRSSARRCGGEIVASSRGVRSYPNGRLGMGYGSAHDRGTARAGDAPSERPRCGRTPERLHGFMFPRSATGRSSLVPPPPWHYSGQMLTIEYRTDPGGGRRAAARAAVAGRRGSGRRRRDLGRLAELQRRRSRSCSTRCGPSTWRRSSSSAASTRGRRTAAASTSGSTRTSPWSAATLQGYPKKLGELYLTRPVNAGSPGRGWRPADASAPRARPRTAADRRHVHDHRRRRESAGFVNGHPMMHSPGDPGHRERRHRRARRARHDAGYDVEVGPVLRRRRHDRAPRVPHRGDHPAGPARDDRRLLAGARHHVPWLAPPSCASNRP